MVRLIIKTLNQSYTNCKILMLVRHLNKQCMQ